MNQSKSKSKAEEEQRLHRSPLLAVDAERQRMMEEEKIDGIDHQAWVSSSSSTSSTNYPPSYWWWGAASSVQMILGIASYRRGCRDSIMPFQAFSVASLFVGSGATAVTALLSASGIHKVQDLKDLGANIRTGLRVPPRETK